MAQDAAGLVHPPPRDFPGVRLLVLAACAWLFFLDVSPSSTLSARWRDVRGGDAEPPAYDCAAWVHAAIAEEAARPAPRVESSADSDSPASPPLNVVLTTAGGRAAALSAALSSVAPQLRETDYLTVLSDAQDAGGARAADALALSAVPTAATKVAIFNAQPLGWWGAGSRTRWGAQRLPGTLFLHADDDVVFAPDALDSVRAAVARARDARLYLFRAHLRARDVLPPPHISDVAQLRAEDLVAPCGVFRAPLAALTWPRAKDLGGGFLLALVQAVGVQNVTLETTAIAHVGQGGSWSDGKWVSTDGDSGPDPAAGLPLAGEGGAAQCF